MRVLFSVFYFWCLLASIKYKFTIRFITGVEMNVHLDNLHPNATKPDMLVTVFQNRNNVLMRFSFCEKSRNEYCRKYILLAVWQDKTSGKKRNYVALSVSVSHKVNIRRRWTIFRWLFKIMEIKRKLLLWTDK